MSDSADPSKDPNLNHASTWPGPAPRILVARVGAIGDTLMVTPALRAVRRSLPNGFVGLLVSDGAGQALRYNPNADRVFALAHWRTPGWLNPAKRRLSDALRRERFDAALVLESDERFLPLVRSINSVHVVAYGALATAGGFDRADFDPRAHMIDNHLAAARRLGIEPAGREMELGLPEQLELDLLERLAALGVRRDGVVAGLHAGWGGRKHSITRTRLKSWPPGRFAEVARWLAESAGAQVVLTGAEDDRDLNEWIARRSGVRCLNLAAKLSLVELIALLRRLSVYITVDSGPAHMAAALGTPLITLIGPAIIEQTAPIGRPGAVRILYHRVPCAPCYGTPLMKACRDNVCMKEISVDEVLAAAGQMLETTRLAERHLTPDRSSPRPQA